MDKKTDVKIILKTWVWKKLSKGMHTDQMIQGISIKD